MRQVASGGKKRFGVGLMVVLLAILLVISACGSQNTGKESGSGAAGEGVEQSQQSPQPQTSPQLQQAEGGKAAKRTYEHTKGSSEIPVKAERVVTDWYYGQLVALGLKPVGTDDFVWKNHPFIEQAGTVSIGQSLEKIIELEPDLIISWGAAKYDDYSKIAPTVPLELNGGPKEAVRIFGDILGRKDEAEKWITQFDNTVQQAKKQLAEAISPNETFTIFNAWKKTLRVYGFVNMGGYALYEALQAKPAPKVEETFRNAKEWYREISFEAIPEFAGDHIILTSYDPEGTSTVLKDLEASAVWNSLDAVKNGRVYIIDYNKLYNDDPIAIEHQVKLLVEAISAKR